MRVKPIFKYSLLASALALPTGAYALGLGRLTVESYVGQPLVARIELLAATKEELDTLSAKVADSNLYRQNNLTYQSVLARTRVAVERGPNDTAFLRVTSNAPVSEPYLDLLVEANWSAGRVVRDYTFLLDPPGAQQATVDPITPVRPGTAAPAPRTQPAPTTTGAAPTAAPSTAAPTAAAPRGDGGAHEVRRGDTLSKIAAQYKPETVTLDQMLVALFKSNTSAFEGNNMNRLRTGVILTIPNAVEASASSARESTREVQVQAGDWRTYRDRVAGAAPTAEESTTRTAAGRIGTSVQETTPATRPGSDQLRVSKDAGTARGTAAAESTASQTAALRDAQGRIAELEKTLKDMQRALELRNQTMAQVQTQAEKGKTATPAPTPPAPITTPAPATTPPPKAAEPPKPAVVEPPKAAVTEPPKAAEPPKPAVTEPPKAVEPPKAAVIEPPKAAEPPKPAVTEPPKVVDTPKATTPPPKPAAAKAPAKEAPGFFDDLLSGIPGWGLIAGIVVIIAGLVALFAARRRKTTKFEDSIISGTDIKTNTVFGSTGGGVVNTGDNSLASDFSREGLGNIDTDEVDPIAEAEVYLAYGRDAQAEEILKDALKKDPQRQEIYLKLLEIHAQHNKPSAFETVASELYAVNNGQGEVWQKAVTLGRQLDPANPMFAEGGAPTARAAAAVASEAAAADNVAIRTGDEGLAYQMDEEISISPTSGAKPRSTVDAINAAEADMDKTARLTASDFDPDRTMALPPHSAPLAPAPEVPMHDKVEAASAKASQMFDLDFKLDEVEKPAPIQRPREPVLEAATATASSGSAPAQLARPAAALELDKLDLAFDPDRSTFEDPTPSVLDGQWHDAATKLDLAKAYQEMGDVEGAREILQEVLHEGDDQQKSEAKSLLAKLG